MTEQTEVKMETESTPERLETTINKVSAHFGLSKNFKIVYAGYDELAKSYLEQGEYVIMGAMQSRIDRPVTPHLLLLTNKKVLILDPSYSDLHLHTTLFGATKIERIPYNAIKDVKLEIGRLLSTITLKIIGVSDITMHGIKHNEARRISSIIECIIECYG